VIDAPNEPVLVHRKLIPVEDGLLVTLGKGEIVRRALEELEGAGGAPTSSTATDSARSVEAARRMDLEGEGMIRVSREDARYPSRRIPAR
jgi:hypothetical protein